jgi:acyl dehydratase
MAALAPHSVEAFNVSRQSENKIHDDAVARRFGFRGGLVPGAEVYAYMAHMPVARWGRDWLQRGGADCRFFKPVYEGETVTVTASEHDGALSIEVTSQDGVCATGTATLPADAAAPPSIDDFRHVAPASSRPAADETSLAEGAWFGINPLNVTPEFAAQYLHDVRETDALYAREALAHPGLVPRLCNMALTHNVVLGPWIHVGGEVRNFAPIRVGDVLLLSARVTANYERKGHRLVDLDVLVIGNARVPLARAKHVAIYRPRQVAEATAAA